MIKLSETKNTWQNKIDNLEKENNQLVSEVENLTKSLEEKNTIIEELSNRNDLAKSKIKKMYNSKKEITKIELAELLKFLEINERKEISNQELRLSANISNSSFRTARETSVASSYVETVALTQSTEEDEDREQTIHRLENLPWDKNFTNNNRGFQWLNRKEKE